MHKQFTSMKNHLQLEAQDWMEKYHDQIAQISKLENMWEEIGSEH